LRALNLHKYIIAKILTFHRHYTYDFRLCIKREFFDLLMGTVGPFRSKEVRYGDLHGRLLRIEIVEAVPQCLRRTCQICVYFTNLYRSVRIHVQACVLIVTS